MWMHKLLLLLLLLVSKARKVLLNRNRELMRRNGSWNTQRVDASVLVALSVIPDDNEDNDAGEDEPASVFVINMSPAPGPA